VTVEVETSYAPRYGILLPERETVISESGEVRYFYEQYQLDRPLAVSGFDLEFHPSLAGSDRTETDGGAGEPR
jgi:hypothetical protein